MKKNKYNISKFVVIIMLVLSIFVNEKFWEFLAQLRKNSNDSLNLASTNTEFAVLVDGEKRDNFPEKGSGYVFDSIMCDKGTTGTWNKEKWQLDLNFKGPDKCTVSFIKDPRVEPVFTVTPDVVSIGRGGSSTVSYSYNGDGNVTCSAPASFACTIDSEKKSILIKANSAGDGKYTVNILASETDNFFAANRVVNVSVTCLDPKTLVYVWDRKKKKKRKIKIKDVKVGDIVYSYDNVTKKFVTSVVKKVHINKSRDIYDLFVDGEVIRITGSHPLYVNGMGYCEVSCLEAGYEIMGLDNKMHIVEKVESVYVEEECEMYCLELENNKSFLIGKNNLISLAMYVGILTAMYFGNPINAHGIEPQIYSY